MFFGLSIVSFLKVSKVGVIDEEVLIEITGFGNYHKIAVRDHIRVPKFWRT